MLNKKQLKEMSKIGVFKLLLKDTERKYVREDIEDAFMSSLQHWTVNKKENVTTSDVIGRARVVLLRKQRKEAGLRQRDGEASKAGRTLHVMNVYDDEGCNIIESMGYCDESHELVF